MYYKRPPTQLPALVPPQRLVKITAYTLPQPHQCIQELSKLDAFSAAPGLPSLVQDPSVGQRDLPAASTNPTATTQAQQNPPPGDDPATSAVSYKNPGW